MALACLLDTQAFTQQPVCGPSGIGTDGNFLNWYFFFFFFEDLVVITVGEKQASVLDL